MKFTEMPYSRPSADELIAIGEKTLEKFNAATTAAEQYEAMQEFEKASGTFDTLSTLAYVRHTIDTRDEFYDAEIEYIDEVSPRVGEIINKLNKAMLASEFRAELEQMLGKLVFVNLEISARTFAPENIELMQQENKLVSEYQKLYASAIVEFNGEKMPLPKLGPFKESPDRAVRRAAYETEGKFFDDNATADIVVSEQKDKMIVEVTIRTADMIYRAEERDVEVYNAADDVVDAITRQIRKNKTRLAKKLREGVSKEVDFFDEVAQDDVEIKIVKTKTHQVKPMSAEEAVLQMNLLGHNFYIFRNAQTNTTDIVYRRKDGNYGLIETD